MQRRAASLAVKTAYICHQRTWVGLLTFAPNASLLSMQTCAGRRGLSQNSTGVPIIHMGHLN